MSIVTSKTEQSRAPGYVVAKRSSWQGYPAKIVIYGLLIFMSILFLIPFYIIIRNGLMSQPEITAPDWIWLPSSLHFENLDKLFNDPLASMAVGLRNSLLIAVT